MAFSPHAFRQLTDHAHRLNNDYQPQHAQHSQGNSDTTANFHQVMWSATACPEGSISTSRTHNLMQAIIQPDASPRKAQGNLPQPQCIASNAKHPRCHLSQQYVDREWDATKVKRTDRHVPDSQTTDKHYGNASTATTTGMSHAGSNQSPRTRGATFCRETNQ